MTKSELLAKTIGLISRCKADLEKILSWDFLTEEERNEFNAMLKKSNEDLSTLKKDGEVFGENILEVTFNDYYNNVYSKLQGFQKDRTKKEEPKKEEPVKEGTPAPVPAPVKEGEKKPEEGTKAHVAEVKPEEDQTDKEKEATKKGKNWWKYMLTALGAAGLAVLITLMCKGCSKDLDKTKPEDTTTPTSIEQVDTTHVRGIEDFDIDDVNIENYGELLTAAQKIQENLPADKNGKKIPVEQIMYAIKFANWDDLENKGIFREAEEIYSATMTIGNIMAANNINADDLIKEENQPVISDTELTDVLLSVTDLALTLEDFSAAKVENGYSLYSVLELCGEKIDVDYDKFTNDDDKVAASNDAFNYAKVYSDIVSRTTRNFSMLADSEDLAPMYIILGNYNAKLPKILELCAGRYLSTIYGTGIRNDGTYGDICIEELAAASRIIYDNGGYSGSEYSIFLNRGTDSFIDGVILTEEYNGNPLGR